MHRTGSYEQLKDLLFKMKEKIPNLALRTTFMVGFPGESDEHFEELCRFIKEIKFDKMGCFTYSAEEDTPAAEYDNQIDEEVKKRRADFKLIITLKYYSAVNLGRIKISSAVIHTVVKRINNNLICIAYPRFVKLLAD